MQAEEEVKQKADSADESLADANAQVEEVNAAVEDIADVQTQVSDTTQVTESDVESNAQASEESEPGRHGESTKVEEGKVKTKSKKKGKGKEEKAQLKPVKVKKATTKPEEPPADGGVAAWVLTFADLMSLLMAFFVLLYSMSEVDKAKFEEFGKSMREALGKPIKLNADIEYIDPEMAPTPEQIKEQIQQTTQDAEALKKLLQPQIEEKVVEVEQHGQVIMIRMLQQGVFGSGNAKLEDDFIPVLEKISQKLNTVDGELIVSGHTDNVPVKGGQYRSNWELSASRAYSVIEVLQSMHNIPEDRFVLRGFGDTRPQAPNDTAENRAKNRRVEIMIDQRVTLADSDKKAVEDLQKTADKVLDEKGSF